MACLLAASLARKGRDEECGIPLGNGARYLVKLIRKRLVQGCAAQKVSSIELGSELHAITRTSALCVRSREKVNANPCSSDITWRLQASKMRAHLSSFVEVRHVGNREKQPKSVILLG